MSHPSPQTRADVVVLDNSPPRRQASSPSPSDEVIVLDHSPSINPDAALNGPSEPIIVEENPPKRRRRDNPAALPLHPRTTTRPDTAPAVIVVEDDEDSSDPESHATTSNPTSFTSVGPVPNPRPHVRLPRMNTRRNIRVQDDVIEMSATGPTINRTASVLATPNAPPMCPPPTPPTRTRHTSMPPLFSFTRRSTLAPEVAAPTPPTAWRNIPRSLPAQLRNLVATHQTSPQLTNTNSSRHIPFPHPLPEQALPSTGRRAGRGSRRHVSFAESISEEVLTPGARATLSVLRGLEEEGIRGTGPPTGLPRPSVEPFIQVVNGPSVYFDIPQNVQNAMPPSQSTLNNHSSRPADSARPTSLPHPGSLHRRQGHFTRRAPVAGTGNPPHRSGVQRTVRFAPQSIAHAHMQQLNAMHAASNGMPLQGDGLSFLPQSGPNATNTALPSSHRMIVTANLRNGSAAPRAVANVADAAAAATASTMANLSSAGLTLPTSQAPLSYGQGSDFTLSSSGSTTSSHRSQMRQSTTQRHAQSIRRFQRLLRITGSTAGLEIQYLQGVHGDRVLDYEQLIRLDEQLIREKNRADETEIEALPVRIATVEDKEVRCCVCMCDVEEGEELRVLPCSHKYHKKCIDEWLTYNGCCPVDKKRIAPRSSRSRFTAS